VRYERVRVTRPGGKLKRVIACYGTGKAKLDATEEKPALDLASPLLVWLVNSEVRNLRRPLRVGMLPLDQVTPCVVGAVTFAHPTANSSGQHRLKVRGTVTSLHIGRDAS